MVDRLIGSLVDWLPTARRLLSHGSRVVFYWLREVSEDAAYERYQARWGTKSTLTAAEFYRERLERKYSRPCRCC